MSLLYRTTVLLLLLPPSPSPVRDSLLTRPDLPIRILNVLLHLALWTIIASSFLSNSRDTSTADIAQQTLTVHHVLRNLRKPLIVSSSLTSTPPSAAFPRNCMYSGMTLTPLQLDPYLPLSCVCLLQSSEDLGSCVVGAMAHVLGCVGMCSLR